METVLNIIKLFIFIMMAVSSYTYLVVRMIKFIESGRHVLGLLIISALMTSLIVAIKYAHEIVRIVWN